MIFNILCINPYVARIYFSSFEAGIAIDWLIEIQLPPVWCFSLFYFFQNPEERLGCHHQTGFAEIQAHPFYRIIDWDQLLNKQIAPPHKPNVKSEVDLELFDPLFTSEPVQLTPDDPWVLLWPVNTIRWSNVGVMLGQRRRRWANIALVCIVSMFCVGWGIAFDLR